MSWTYVDTSFVIAVLTGELSSRGASKLVGGGTTKLISSYLLEAEVLSVARRESLPEKEVIAQLAKIHFVAPRSLQQECSAVLSVGYLRGADLYHVATALWLQGKHSGLAFVTLDSMQRTIASKVLRSL